jgi:hypothetical protein
MPAILLIGALLLGGRMYLRHRRLQLARRGGQEAAQRWEDEGGALHVKETPRA